MLSRETRQLTHLQGTHVRAFPADELPREITQAAKMTVQTLTDPLNKHR